MKIVNLLSVYKPSYPENLIYMMQSVEYLPIQFLKWFWRTKDFGSIMYRRTLKKTKIAMVLYYSLVFLIIFQVALGATAIFYGYVLVGLVIVALYPITTPLIMSIPLLLGRKLIIEPHIDKIVSRAEAKIKKHSALKIAVAGSYGKTTMKEILFTVFSEGKSTVATPGNMNVLQSHAKFINSLKGDEEIIIFEFGEGAPGDIKKFAQLTHPDIAILTGIAPAHLDRYKTIDNVARDLLSITEFVEQKSIYVNKEGRSADLISKRNSTFGNDGIAKWKIENVKSSVHGLNFDMIINKKTVSFSSGLVGEHQLAPLALAIKLAYEFNIPIQQIQKGVSATKPFEHRMQPIQLSSGALAIDDTYNGNIEGVTVGLKLLKSLKAKRKIYVTPGLVDQGDEAQRVHEQMGLMIGDANPDQVVLIKNSACDHIKKGLASSNYDGEVIIRDDPLEFYTHLDQLFASGDLIFMQNDWTDNYH